LLPGVMRLREDRWAVTVPPDDSGRLRSETATRNRYAIRGYASTAIKHGHDALTAIRDALAGNPLDAAHSRSRMTTANRSHASKLT
jgi:hypothetical protein